MPNTVNKAFEVPNTGDLPGAWGTSALNPNFSALDGITGGVLSLSVSSATTITLSVPSGSLTPGAGPTQSQNALIKLSGTLTGNSQILFAMPGFYIVDNRCTGNFYVQLGPTAGTGTFVGAPPGEKCHVFYDGTNMDFVDMGRVGSALDLHTNTTTLPPWMNACTVPPYLIKNGATHTVSLYPALAAMLGSTYGGNGITTFGVPDELSRFRLPVDSSGSAGRVTSAVSGINGTTFGSAGGSQLMQQHTHTVTDPGHVHSMKRDALYGSGSASAVNGVGVFTPKDTDSAVTGISINNAGTGTSQNMPPAIVDFLPLIKT